jgi:hypothetical protein
VVLGLDAQRDILQLLERLSIEEEGGGSGSGSGSGRPALGAAGDDPNGDGQGSGLLQLLINEEKRLFLVGAGCASCDV